MGKKGFDRRAPPRTSWDAVAHWYNGWMGEDGSEHHRQLAIPAVMELLEVQTGEKILDLGSGQGVLAPYIYEAGANYIGVEASPTLRQFAEKHHKRQGKFLLGDVSRLDKLDELKAAEFDAVVFLLSIQDMNPLQSVLNSAAWALKPGGKLVILMTHPCFRVPRQSGWGWDESRKLQYRRIDHYLTALSVPMKAFTDHKKGVTFSFHRPMEEYVNGLANCGLLVDYMKEIPGNIFGKTDAKAEKRAHQEIPLFLGLRARKL